MALADERVRDRIEFLSQGAEGLRQFRGHDLYDRLGRLGLTYGQYFRALDTNVTDYCAQEFGIDLSKITVERFFQSDPNAKWLFPDMVREAVVAGLRRKPKYPELIIRDEPVTSTAYDVPFVTESEENEEMRTVSEGAAIPESEIMYGDRVVKLDKKGRGIIASYEAVRRMAGDMDINAGKIAEEGVPIESVGGEIVEAIQRTAAGEPTCSESLGHQEFILTYKNFTPLGPECLPASA